jgi:hypothetical protein
MKWKCICNIIRNADDHSMVLQQVVDALNSLYKRLAMHMQYIQI